MSVNIETKRLLLKCVDKSDREFQTETQIVFRGAKIQKDLEE